MSPTSTRWLCLYPNPTVDASTDYNMLQVNAGGNWLRNNKLYSGANFHPMTPFIKDAGEGMFLDIKHLTRKTLSVLDRI